MAFFPLVISCAFKPFRGWFDMFVVFESFLGLALCIEGDSKERHLKLTMNHVRHCMPLFVGIITIRCVYFSYEIMRFSDLPLRPLANFCAQVAGELQSRAHHSLTSLSHVVSSFSPKERIRMSLCRLKPSCSAPVGME
jgi:hypothetical protein